MIILLKNFWYSALTVFPFILIKEQDYSLVLLNHEYIHFEQQKECLVVFAYLIYWLEFLVKIFIYKFDVQKTYQNISFEREAYNFEKVIGYVSRRKRYHWVKYIFKI